MKWRKSSGSWTRLTTLFCSSTLALEASWGFFPRFLIGIPVQEDRPPCSCPGVCKGLWTKLEALNRVLEHALCRFAFPKCYSINIILALSSELWAHLFYAFGTTNGHLRQRNHTLQLKQNQSSMNFQLYSMLSPSLEEMVFFLPSICPNTKNNSASRIHV